MEFRDRDFTGETITLDGNEFSGCAFIRCRIVFRGTAPTKLGANRFDACDWIFDGPARLTLAFMTQLYHGGMKDLIEAAIENIRKNHLPGM